MPSRLPSSVALSILLHAIVVVVMGTAFVSCTAPAQRLTPIQHESIDATVISEKQAQSYYERQEALELERQREAARKKEAERKRRALEKEKARKAEEARIQKRKQAEQQRKKEQERLEREKIAKQEAQLKAQQEAEAKKKALQEEQQRKQDELRRQAEESLRAEEAKIKEAENQRLLKMRKQQVGQWTRQYINTLRTSIEMRWKKPPASIKGGDCIVKVKQKEDGTVLDVQVIQCEGDKLYERSVVEAVWKANPLPQPPSQDVFSSEIEMRFKQEYGG